MTAHVREFKSFGLQTFKVYVNGVEVTECLSVNAAISYLKSKFPNIRLERANA